MAVPITREGFKLNALRRLGWPTIKVNLDDDTIEDRIDEALDYFYQFAFDGTEQVYYTVQLTPTDITNRYLTIPTSIQGVSRALLPNTGLINGEDMFNIRYQIAMNDIYSISSISMVPYFMVMEQLSLIEEVLIGTDPIRFSRHTGRLYIDTDWAFLSAGNFVIIEAWQQIDADANPSIWSDRWLQKYATALIKKNWADILIKFPNMQLPGGITFNGQTILQEAKEEISKLEKEMQDTYSLPPQSFLF
jgi:hypothetical protein